MLAAPVAPIGPPMIQVVVALSGLYEAPAPLARPHTLALSGAFHSVDLHEPSLGTVGQLCRGPILGWLYNRHLALVPRLGCLPASPTHEFSPCLA